MASGTAEDCDEYQDYQDMIILRTLFLFFIIILIGYSRGKMIPPGKGVQVRLVLRRPYVHYPNFYRRIESSKDARFGQ